MKVESAQAAYAANTQQLTQAEQVETTETAPETLEEDTVTLTQASPDDGGASTNSGNSGGELPPRPPE